MEGPRLSVVSADCDDNPSSDICPGARPTVCVETLTVHGGVGVQRGDVNNFIVNQYLVTDSLSASSVSQLTDSAVHVNTQTAKIVTDHLPGKKEDLERLQRRWCVLITALLCVSCLTLFIVSLFSFGLVNVHPLANPPPVTDQSDPRSSIPDNSTDDYKDLLGAPRVFRRRNWLAQPPYHPLAPNTLPIKMVIVCHTATDECQTTSDCVLSVRYIQMFHMESFHWDDIGYSFLIGGDGIVYEGRGWDMMGAHTKGHNLGTLGVAFIGTFVNKMPNDLQVEAFHKLLDVGVRIGKVATDYTLVAQCQLQVTASPGFVLARNLTSWPHYDASKPILCTKI